LSGTRGVLMKCKINGCDEKHRTKGFCGKHYMRMKRHGDPNITLKCQGAHGHSGHLLYGVWRAMKARCYNSNNKKYEYYGGRGIIVCKEWLVDFMNFYSWAIKNGWEKGLQIDRKENDGNYEPENCRFVTSKSNNNNQRLLKSSNSSGYRGVDYHSKTKTWRARIRDGATRTCLGYFKSPALAALRYDVEAYLLNDGRPMNFIDRI